MSDAFGPTFPLVLGPDPGTAVIVHAGEHLRHAAKMSRSVDGEVEQDGTLALTLPPGPVQPDIVAPAQLALNKSTRPTISD